MNKKICVKLGTDGGLTRRSLEQFYPNTTSVQCRKTVSFVKFQKVSETIEALQKILVVGGIQVEVCWAEHAVDAGMLPEQLAKEQKEAQIAKQNTANVPVAQQQNVVYSYPQYITQPSYNLVPQQPLMHAQLSGQINNGHTVIYQPPAGNQIGMQNVLIPVTVATVQAQPVTTGNGLLQPNSFVAPQNQMVPAHLQQAVPYNSQPQQPTTTVAHGPFVATGTGHLQQTNGQVLSGTNQTGQQQPYGQQGGQKF